MNSLQTCSIWNANVNFAIKSSEPPESRIHTVWAVGGSHDNHMSTLLETIHECQQLGDNTSLYLTMGLWEREEREGGREREGGGRKEGEGGRMEEGRRREDGGGEKEGEEGGRGESRRGEEGEGGKEGRGRKGCILTGNSCSPGTYLISLWSNGVKFINKDNCRGILFCLFKGCGWRQKMKLPQTKEVGNMVSLQVQNLKEADTFS